MKNKIWILLIILIVVIAIGFFAFQKSHNNSVVEDEIINNISNPEIESDFEESVPKSEQTGTAGSNMPIKDNLEEAEYQINVAMQYLFEEMYGDKVFDARIYIEKVYTTEDENEVPALKEMNLGPDEVAFEVKYELKPASGVDPNTLITADGEYDEETEWITNIYRVGILRPNGSGEPKYKITDFGTGW